MQFKYHNLSLSSTVLYSDTDKLIVKLFSNCQLYVIDLVKLFIVINFKLLGFMSCDDIGNIYGHTSRIFCSFIAIFECKSNININTLIYLYNYKYIQLYNEGF